MKYVKLLSFLMVAFLCLILAFSGTSVAEQKTFKIGVCMALTGPGGAWGIPIGRNATNLVADYFNTRGGLNVGGQKYKIVVVEADTQFTPEVASTAARRLVEKDKIDLMVGPLAGATTPPAQAVTEAAGILQVHTAAPDETITKDKRHAFRSFISYYEMFPGVLRWVKKAHPEVKKIALLGLNYESSWYGHKLVEQLAPRLGFEIVYNDYYEPGTKDMYPHLQKLMAKNPHAIFNTSSPTPPTALIVKQAKELGYKGIFFQGHSAQVDEMAKIASKKALEGFISGDYLTKGPKADPRTKAFIQKAIDKYGSWDANTFINTPTLFAVLMAIEEAGTLNVDKIIALLESGKVWDTPVGIKGTFGMKKKYGHDHQWLAPQWMHEVKNGKNTPIGEITIEEMIHGWD